MVHDYSPFEFLCFKFQAVAQQTSSSFDFNQKVAGSSPVKVRLVAQLVEIKDWFVIILRLIPISLSGCAAAGSFDSSLVRRLTETKAGCVYSPLISIKFIIGGCAANGYFVFGNVSP